ncbi:MAG: RluA family pseudouridine synthase [Bacteroidia bacterium]|nr:RluA family pseudouridine synthase [Bacteroidia bacterium]NNC86002.1 RluA family pseudouridine synthase [Bacteroidia bacterium]NNM16631.1 RluA family pseudouridine synthase [Bacteroidia bacterium]
MDESVENSEQEELYEHHRFDVDKGQSPLRIDKFLLSRLVNTSRNRIQNAATAGSILVNKKAVKSNYKVRPGDVVSIVLAHPPREIELYADNVPIKIVYEDDEIIVVDKQAGMVVHPAYGNYRNTLVNALCYHLHPQLENKVVPEDITRPGLVHRIDKNTSGLLLVAKNETAITFLAKQFYEKTVDRNYLALVWGDFEDTSGTITGDVGRNLKDRKVMDVFNDGKHGKHAVTHYEVLERFGYVSLVRCKLETGRTHQIRVHFKYIKHPLFNDETYGGNRILKGTRFSKYKAFVNNCFNLLPRQALHAHTLGFIHPKTNEKMSFTSDLPSEFEAVLNKWRKYINVQPVEGE